MRIFSLNKIKDILDIEKRNKESGEFLNLRVNCKKY